MFAICMKGLLSTLSDNEPKWQLENSLIGSNPGLGLRPLPQELSRGALISYKSNSTEEVDYWAKLLSTFLKRNIRQHSFCFKCH